MSVHHWFYGPHRHSTLGRYEIGAENRRLALARIASITVTPEELVLAISKDGVECCYAAFVITRLLDRAENEALSRTFGTAAPDPHRIIRDLLEHAVYDRERSDECADAVEAAERYLVAEVSV